MENLLALISMVTGIGAGTIALVLSKKQPEKQKQMRGMGFMFYGLAALMGVLLFV